MIKEIEKFYHEFSFNEDVGAWRRKHAKKEGSWNLCKLLFCCCKLFDFERILLIGKESVDLAYTSVISKNNIKYLMIVDSFGYKNSRFGYDLYIRDMLKSLRVEESKYLLYTEIQARSLPATHGKFDIVAISSGRKDIGFEIARSWEVLKEQGVVLVESIDSADKRLKFKNYAEMYNFEGID